MVAAVKFFQFLHQNPVVLAVPLVVLALVDLENGVHDWMVIVVAFAYVGWTVVKQVRGHRLGAPWVR